MTKKSVLQLNEEARRQHNTNGNSFEDFPVGTRVKIICLGQDYYFFFGETGVVIQNSGSYLGIRVEFDTPRHFEDGATQEAFGFNPDDLIREDQRGGKNT